MPFELGRPLGMPNDAKFQKRVLLAALKLFESKSGPLLKDFQEDAPVSGSAEVIWACPINLAASPVDLSGMDAMRDALKREVRELRSWYDLAVKKRGRTTMGVSGLNMEELVDFIGAFLDGIPQNPREDLLLAYTLNFAVDDLKAYYYEAATAQPGGLSPTSSELDNWFWGETVAAKVLFAVKSLCLKSDDKLLQFVGMILLIPMAHTPINA